MASKIILARRNTENVATALVSDGTPEHASQKEKAGLSKAARSQCRSACQFAIGAHQSAAFPLLIECPSRIAFQFLFFCPHQISLHYRP